MIFKGFERLGLRHGILLMLAILIFLGGASCSKEQAPQIPVLVATIHPYELLLKELAGSGFEVKCLIPGTASPHTWSPVPADLKALSEASFVLSNGLGLEANIEQNLKQMQDKHLQAADLLHDLIVLDSLKQHAIPDSSDHKHHEGLDPHIWTSTHLMKRLISKLEKELGTRFPNSAFIFSRNAGSMRKKLEATDRQIKNERAAFSDPAIVTYHNSFEYFTKEYGIHTLAWVQASPAKEPTPSELASLGQIITQHKVKALFIEPQMNPKSGEVLSREFGLQMITIDPLGSNSQATGIAELILEYWQIMKQAF